MLYFFWSSYSMLLIGAEQQMGRWLLDGQEELP